LPPSVAMNVVWKMDCASAVAQKKTANAVTL
jgi:hypothetical protein